MLGLTARCAVPVAYAATYGKSNFTVMQEVSEWQSLHVQIGESRAPMTAAHAARRQRAAGVALAQPGRVEDRPPGLGIMPHHRGNTPSGKKHAAKLRMEWEAKQAGRTGELPESPKEVIRLLIAIGSKRVLSLENLFDDWDDMSPAERSMALRSSLDERNSLSTLSVNALKLQLDEDREVREISTLVIWAVDRALAVAEIDLSRSEMRRFGAALADALKQYERRPMSELLNQPERELPAQSVG